MATARQRRWRAANRERYNANMRAWQARQGAEARRAKAAVGKAVKAGEMIRPLWCEACGADARLQGHHDDYSKPLDVRWLCKACHARHHAFTRRAALKKM